MQIVCTSFEKKYVPTNSRSSLMSLLLSNAWKEKTVHSLMASVFV